MTDELPAIQNMPWRNGYKHMNKRHLPLDIAPTEKRPDGAVLPRMTIRNRVDGSFSTTMAFHDYLHQRDPDGHDHTHRPRRYR